MLHIITAKGIYGTLQEEGQWAKLDVVNRGGGDVNETSSVIDGGNVLIKRGKKNIMYGWEAGAWRSMHECLDVFTSNTHEKCEDVI